MNTLQLKSINELLNEQFYIPSYQRGYRWGTSQINALLDDIWDYSSDKNKSQNNENQSFYCLQPIVVKKIEINDKLQWEVIDGQQRLTTLYIILNYINLIEYTNKPRKLYGIEYQTRKDCSAFFQDIDNKELASSNIDYFYINHVHEEVMKWFDKKEQTNEVIRHDFRSKLMGEVKVIWYEVEKPTDTDHEPNSIDIFTRLNIGKIPLTNAELIKALFLQKTNFKNENATLKQLQIATEWDNIEKSLQNDEFWFFIYNKTNAFHYDNRIEYIFDLMKDKTKECENYYTFYEFNKDFTLENASSKTNAKVDSIWYDIKKYFLTFDEWFNDKQLYHLIGYLIDSGKNINEIKKKSYELKKNEFIQYLKSEIRETVKCNIDELEYGNKKIKNVLLLFNIVTLLSSASSSMRFPFHRYKNENWDIEHINSRTDFMENKDNINNWIVCTIEYFTGIRECTTQEEKNRQYLEIEELKSEDKDQIDTEKYEVLKKLVTIAFGKNITGNELSELYEKMQKILGDKGIEDKDSIGNLTLLDSSTNRSYGNSMFPIKRKIIINKDMNGVFIPICTKNVFLKSYSKKLGDNMNWTDSDAESYCISIKLTLKDYLPQEDENVRK